MTSEELLYGIPTSVELQQELQGVAAGMRILHVDPSRAVKGFEVLVNLLNLLPPAAAEPLKLGFSVMMRTGNFCNAGGKVIFVDPPDSEEEPCRKAQS